MDITDIIGKGKAFEPPFRCTSRNCTIVDKNNRTVLELPDLTRRLKRDFYGWGRIAAGYFYQHIVELLNEYWKDESND